MPAEKLPRAFYEDLHLTLAREHEAVLSEALKRSKLFLRSQTDTEFSRLVSEIKEATGCEERVAWAVFRFATSVATWMAGDEDKEKNADEIIASIQRQAPDGKSSLKSDEESRLRVLMARMATTANATRQAIQAQFITRGVLPKYQSLLATLELRSMKVAAALGKTAATDVPLELLPIASVRLDLDSGYPDFVCFQATEDDLASLQEQIEQLRAGLRELKEKVQVISQ